MNRKRKFVLAGSAVVAAWLTLASVAYACTAFQGAFKVTNSATGNWVQGDACNDPALFEGMKNAITHSGTAPKWSASNTFSITTGATTTTACSSTSTTPATANMTLPTNDYEVGLQNPGYQQDNCCEGFAGNLTCSLDARQLDRLPPPANAGVGQLFVLGHVHIDTTGAIDTYTPINGTTVTATTASFSVPNNVLSSDPTGLAGTRAALCISDLAMSARGNSVPVNITGIL